MKEESTLDALKRAISKLKTLNELVEYYDTEEYEDNVNFIQELKEVAERNRI